MNLTGKKVCFIGDSITEGVGASSNEFCYVSRFATAHPEATVYNFGIGGTRIAPQTVPSESRDGIRTSFRELTSFPKSLI